jgi:hypothetical protein
MIDVEKERIAQGVPDAAWREDTRFCHRLRVKRVVAETHDAMSIVLEVPPALAESFPLPRGTVPELQGPGRRSSARAQLFALERTRRGPGSQGDREAR